LYPAKHFGGFFNWPGRVGIATVLPELRCRLGEHRSHTHDRIGLLLPVTLLPGGLDGNGMLSDATGNPGRKEAGFLYSE
jgi:hypothetical protein